MTRKSYVFPIFLILFTVWILPFSYASVESEAEEDKLAGCVVEESLVYRFAYKDYVCVEPSTATRWVELGFAEIIQNSTNTEKEAFDENATYEEKYPGAPPPAPTKSSSTEIDSECREGQVLVYRYTHHDTFCTNQFTALTWEILGMVEIIDIEKSEQKTIDVDDELQMNEAKLVEETPEVIEETPEVIEETPEVIEETPEVIEEERESHISQHSNHSNIKMIDVGMWVMTDDQKNNSILIEGDDGVLVVNSLNSYKSVKSALSEIEFIPEKKIKSIILTSVDENFISSSKAFLEAGDDTVEVIISETLLQSYEHDHDIEIENLILYDAEFSVDIAGIDVDLVFHDGFTSERTYLIFPKYEGFLIGDSVGGLFPGMISFEILQNSSD